MNAAHNGLMPLYAFNETWNPLEAEGLGAAAIEATSNTNVVGFCDAYDHTRFLFGGGVANGGGAEPIVDGPFGVSGQRQLAEAMARLRTSVAAGEGDIDVVGFSRGAALALAFAGRIASANDLCDIEGRPPRIRFIGLFDVVGSFAFAADPPPLTYQESTVANTLSLPPNVDHCFHAMALDERRAAFRVTRVNGAYEVWFRGVHSDVGGGNGNTGLNSIARRWMLRKAYACGLPIRQDRIAEANATAMPLAPVLWPDDLAPRAFRTVDQHELVHCTVMRPSLNVGCNEPPASCPTEDVVRELTAFSVSLAS